MSRPEPSATVGDPRGPKWSAHPLAGVESVAEDPAQVRGDTIRFFWDEGVTVPLWDADGLLPDDPEWLRAALGLSDGLIADLTAWGAAHQQGDRPTCHQTEALAARLRAELPPDLRLIDDERR